MSAHILMCVSLYIIILTVIYLFQLDRLRNRVKGQLSKIRLDEAFVEAYRYDEDHGLANAEMPSFRCRNTRLTPPPCIAFDLALTCCV